MNRTLTVTAPQRGLYEITDQLRVALAGGAPLASGQLVSGQLVSGQLGSGQLGSGMCHLYLRHTSASLIIQENADPSVLADLEDWLDRLVPDGDPRFRHDAEGPDDMPAHIKGAITATELSIPLVDGALALGRWQGVFLFEHRTVPRPRELVLSVWATLP